MNPATRLAGLAVRALAAAGVGHVVLCPGSRSAPLAYELARAAAGADLQLHIRHDERVAAFTALGVGLSGTTIGAVATTSGTAVANLAPAVLEAHHANRPLVVVTADRPPALRGTWANQTSELQTGLFGDAVRARLDLDDAAAAADPLAALEALVTTLIAAGGGRSSRPGPVHLNLGFTEPLLPDGDRDAAVDVELLPQPASGGSDHPLDHPLGLPQGQRTVVLAGDGAGPAAREFAEAAGLPLLAEPSSLARGGPNAVGPYRLLLDLPELGGAVERVVTFGRPTLSRSVTRLLCRPDVEVVLVTPYPAWPEPGRPVTRCVRVAAEGVAEGVGPRSWLDDWCRAGAAAAGAIDVVLDDEARAGRITGPLLARELWAHLRPGEHLVAGSSNPIRDLDLAAPPIPGPGPAPHVVANRGLAGIDGTVSAATGLALAAGPTRVLLGDVTFLHDVGALLVGPADRRPDLQVVVLNDDGGGIFSLLEYGGLAEAGPVSAAEFDRLFGTPHGADLSALCRGYGVRHELVKDVPRLREALADPGPGTGIVEVRADRAWLRGLHASLGAAARAAAAEALDRHA